MAKLVSKQISSRVSWRGGKLSRLCDHPSFRPVCLFLSHRHTEVCIKAIAAIVGICLFSIAGNRWLDSSLFVLLPVFWATRAGGALPGLLVAITAACGKCTVDSLTYQTGTFMWPTRFITDASVGVSVVVLVGQLTQKLSEARDTASNDALTGCLNRHGIREVADAELERAVLSKQPLTVAMIDLDRFKQVNDLYGHKFGDEILRQLVKALRPAVAAGGYIGRTGGDEFVVIIPDRLPDEVSQALTRSQQRFNDTTLAIGARCTFSCGVAGFPEDGVTIEKLLESADENMYRRKFANFSPERQPHTPFSA